MSVKKVRHIGILGGMGMGSTILMQKYIFDIHARYFKKKPVPEITFFIVDLKKLLTYQFNGEWKLYTEYLSECIKTLEKSGCDFVSMAAVTPHVVFEEIKDKVNIPVLNIFEHASIELEKQKASSALLLATSFTVNSGIFTRIIRKNIKNVILPLKKDQELLDSLIYRSLVNNEKKASYKNEILRLIKKYECESVILGCTDLPLVFSAKDTGIPVVDSLHAHALQTLRNAYSREMLSEM